MSRKKKLRRFKRESARAEERNRRKEECKGLTRSLIENGGNVDIALAKAAIASKSSDVIGDFAQVIPVIGPLIGAAAKGISKGVSIGSDIGNLNWKKQKLQDDLRVSDLGCGGIPFDEIKEKMDDGFNKVGESVDRNFNAIENNSKKLDRNLDAINNVGEKTDRNFRGIENNLKAINRNYGAIERNHGAIKENLQAIKQNYGAIRENYAAIQQVSTKVDRNFEAIERNFDQLKINQGEIRVVGGKVDRNFGAIQHVSSQVDRNLDAIERNFDQLKINQGEIRVVGGKVDRNYGAIQQVSAQVDRNLDAIERNFDQLKINQGEIRLVGGKVDRNFGAIQQVSTQVDRNLQAIERNFNQLEVNEGEIKIVGGKVDRNFGAIKKVSAQVETNFVAIKENLKQMVANNQATRQNYDETRLVSRKVDRNFETLLENYNVTKQNLEATYRNYLAINQVGDKVDRNLSVMLSGFKYIVHRIDEAKNSINNRIDRLQSAIERDKLKNAISQIKNIFDSISTELDGAVNLTHERLVEKLEAREGTLSFLKSVRNPTRDYLHSDLKNIINQNLAIPKDSDDVMAFIVLDLIYSGTELYVSVLYALMRSYVYLATHYYRRNDVEKYNHYLSELEITAKGFVDSLTGVGKNVGLLYEVKGVLNQVKELKFVKEEREDLVEVLAKQIESIEQIRSNLKELVRHLPVEAPAYKLKFDFSNSNISTPLGKWKDGAEVSYAIHMEKSGGFMTKVGLWDTYQIQDRAYPHIGIGKAPAGSKRSIFRKFEGSKPELVGIIEDSKQSGFRDISYDLCIAVTNRNEKSALRELEVLLKNGADINVECKDDGYILNVAAAEGYLNVVSFLIKEQADIEAGDSNDNTPLHIAVKHGHKSIVELLIESGVNVNAKNNLNSTPLHDAARYGNAEIVSLLVQNGAKLNSTTSDGYTPLHTASAAGEAGIVDLLASRNDIDINSTTEDRLTPLHLASSAGHEAVARFLLANNRVNINAKTKDGLTPLHLASTSGSLSIVKLLATQSFKSRARRQLNTQYGQLKVNEQSSDGLSPLHLATFFKKVNVADELLKINEIEVNLKNKEGWTPLHIAALKDEPEVISALYNKNALPESQDHLEQTPLHFAADQGNLAAVEALVKTAKAALNVKRIDGRTPLQLAVIKNKPDVMQFLIKEGARINTRDQTGTSTLDHAIQSENQDLVKGLVELLKKYSHSLKGALHSAALHGNLDILKLLVDAKVEDLNSKDKKGNTPLQVAAAKGHYDMVRYLSDQGAELESKDIDGNSSIHFAALSGDAAMLQYFVGREASVNSTNNHNATPLHFASFSGQAGAVKYLIQRDATNINSQDDGGNTAMHFLAASTKADVSAKIVEYMKQSGVDSDSANKKGYTPLLKFAQTGKWSAARYLVGAGADKKATTPQGETVLHFAARDGNEGMVELLAESNPELTNLRDKSGWSPVFLAAKNGHLNVVRTLIDKQQASYDLTDERGRSLLHVAILSGNEDLVKYLVEERRFKINVADNESSSALHLAAGEGRLAIVELLVKNRAAKNVLDQNNSTPLLRAASGRNWKVVEYLIKNGASIGSGDTLVHKYAEGGALALIKSLKDSNLDKRTARGETPLHLAIANNHQDIVEYLIAEKGVDVQSKDKEGNTPLHHAALTGNLYLVKYLTDKGAEPGAMNNLSRTACDLCRELSVAKYFIDEKGVSYDPNAFKAVENDKLGILKYLIEVQSVDADRPDKDGKTLLHRAAKRGAVDTVKYLVADKRVDIHKKDKSSKEPFFYALQSGHFYVADYLDGMDDRRVPNYGAHLFDLAKEGNVKALEYLIEKLIDVDVKEKNGKTPLEYVFGDKDDDGNSLLHHAVKLDSLSLVKSLVELGAGTNVKNNSGRTPLEDATGKSEIAKYLVENEGIGDVFVAIRRGNLDVIKHLLRNKKTTIDVRDGDGKSLLDSAIDSGQTDVIKYLIDELGMSYEGELLGAAEKGQLNMVKYFIEEKKQEVDTKDDSQCTALFKAAENGHLEVVKYLVGEKQADVNAKDKLQGTPLHAAAEKGNLDIMKYLVENKADLNSKDENNQTPLDIAIEKGHLSVIRYLIDERGLAYNGRIRDASIRGHLGMIKYFLEDKSPDELSHVEGWIPLQLAAMHGHLKCVQYLVEEKHASINVKDVSDATPLHSAAKNGKLDVVRYLISKGADIKARDKSNKTPHDYALEFSHPKLLDSLKYTRKRRSYDAKAEIAFLKIAHDPQATTRTMSRAIGVENIDAKPYATGLVTASPDVLGTLLAFSLLSKLPVVGRFFPANKSRSVNMMEEPQELTVAESVVNATEITEEFLSILNGAAAQLNMSAKSLDLDLSALISKIAQQIRNRSEPYELSKLLLSSAEKYSGGDEKLLSLIKEQLPDLEEAYRLKLKRLAT